jgi:hypothetical protein
MNLISLYKFPQSSQMIQVLAADNVEPPELAAVEDDVAERPDNCGNLL